MSKVGLIMQTGLYAASIVGGVVVAESLIETNGAIDKSLETALDKNAKTPKRIAAGANVATTAVGAAAAGVGAAGLIAYGMLCTGYYGACIIATAKPMLKPIAKSVTKIL